MPSLCKKFYFYEGELIATVRLVEGGPGGGYGAMGGAPPGMGPGMGMGPGAGGPPQPGAPYGYGKPAAGESAPNAAGGYGKSASNSYGGYGSSGGAPGGSRWYVLIPAQTCPTLL